MPSHRPLRGGSAGSRPWSTRTGPFEQHCASPTP
jgi:hypothetical protein